MASTSKSPAAAPAPNPLAYNPLASIDVRWQRAVKTMHVTKEPLKGTLNDVSGVAHAWRVATRHMQLRHIEDSTPRERINRDTLVGVYLTLKNAKLMPTLLHWFIGSMLDNKQMILDDIIPMLEDWKEHKAEGEAFRIIRRLLAWKTEWYRETGAFNHNGVDSYWPFKRTFRTILLSHLPPTFQELLRVTVYSTFNSCKDEAVRARFANDLDNMGILPDFKSHMNAAIEDEITKHIMATCPRVRDRAMLPELKAWFNEDVKSWITDIFGKDRPDHIWRKFEQFMLKALCDLRISELFEIIVDYEDKTHPLPVLQDIKDCLVRTGQRMELVQGLRKQTIKRLLQPGAATSDILQQYVSTIKVLRFLDPPGVLLYGVAEPIRRYLRDRPDTIKIIVTNLIPRRKPKVPEGEEDIDEEDEKDGFLLDEQAEPTPIQANEEAYEDYTDPNWVPAANDAEPTFRVQKPSDTISTLVSIFGSKDLFIKELQIAFGQRLLAISDGNYDEELHNLEILKIRFGDVALQVCEVMMKDLADSRRIDQHVHDALEAPVHTTILSRLFWPPMPRSTLELPGQFQTMQKRYQEEFEKQKPDKKLRYLPNMGSVDLTVEMDSLETLTVTVNPLQAAIIELFSETRRWEVDELAQHLGNLDVTSVSLALMYWHMAGVIEPVERNVFELRESLGETNPSAPMQEDYEIELGLEEGDSEDREANAEMFWNFVRGMLKNLHPMTTEEIHSRFKTAAPIDQSLEESRELLESWLRQGLVDYMSNLWSLP